MEQTTLEVGEHLADIDPAFGHWFAGFVDGEGCFDLHAVHCATKTYYYPRLTIGLRDDDAPVLGEIQRRTGLGSITPRRPKGGINPQVAWSVTRKNEVAPLCALLDRYPLRAKKADDYAIWREAALLWSSLRRGSHWHGANDDYDKLKGYYDKLRESRRYDQPANPVTEPNTRPVTGFAG